MKKIYSIHKKIIGDTITPVSCFLNLRDQYAGLALFESSDYASKANSKSFICVRPLVSVLLNDNSIAVRDGGELKHEPLVDFRKQFEIIQKQYDFNNKKLKELNGFFGAVSYDAVTAFETIELKPKARFAELPEVCLSIYQYIVVFDNFTNEVVIIQNSFDEKALDLSTITKQINDQKISRQQFALQGALRISETEADFLNKVAQAKENVRNGEVFQLVLSRAFSQAFKGDDFEVYRQLRVLNPSPYMFYFEMEKAKIFGASPEAQFRVKKGKAEIHPIAGTVKRTGNEQADLAQLELLKSDPKENAEHTMLVDLARNDLNISCTNVEVTKYKNIQSFSHVYHMVSKVTGDLKSENSMAAFAKSFPAGTLSGAPKYRAMELINQLEAQNRGYYGGAIGQITPDGELNMAIIIRSCVSYKNELHYQAGAGIVMDSIPANELQEIYNKVGAVQSAISLANNSEN